MYAWCRAIAVVSGRVLRFGRGAWTVAKRCEVSSNAEIMTLFLADGNVFSVSSSAEKSSFFFCVSVWHAVRITRSFTYLCACKNGSAL